MAGEEPIVAPVVASPVVEAPAAPAPVETVVAPAPTAPVEAPKHPSEIPTLLESLKAPGAEVAKVEIKPTETSAVEVKPVEAKVEVKPDGEEPKTEEPKAENAPENPIEWDTFKFEFADNVKPQDDKVAAFTEFARENNLTPQAAQKAVGYFNEAATAFVAEQARQQVQVWNDTRGEWRKQVLADPMIGGAGHLSAMGVVARVRDMTISDAQPGTPQYEKDAKEVEDFLRITGAGDHPAFLKMLYRAGARLDEPRQPTIPPSPTKNNGKRPSNSLYASK